MKKYIILFMLVFAGFYLKAQCPATITATITTTAETCNSNGAADIESNAAGSSTTYTLLSAPTGVTVGVPQNPNTFQSLPSGNYTVRIDCESNTATFPFTIADEYNEITNVNTAVTVNCGSFSQGATVNITDVTGGQGTLHYSIYKSTDPNYDDNLSVYGTATSFNVTSYGVYQVRVKDGCGDYYTRTISVQPNLSSVVLAGVTVSNNAACNSNMATLTAFAIDNESGVHLTRQDYFNEGGVIFMIWEGSASGCSPVGSMLATDTISSYDDTMNFPVVASHQYYIQVVTPCGDTSAPACYNLTSNMNPNFSVRSDAGGCTGNPTNPLVENISGNFTYLKYPVTVQIKDASNNVINTSTFNTNTYSIEGLPVGNYTATITDGCGTTITKNVPNPTSGGTPSLNAATNLNSPCLPSGSLSQNGTVYVSVTVTGYVPDIANATVTIVSGPSNVGVEGIVNDNNNKVFSWTNMLPGSYSVHIVTGCYDQNLSFTINPATTLIYTVSATAESYCGGGGTITAIGNYNGNVGSVYDLINTSNGSVVATNNSGIFPNVNAGTYYVKYRINANCPPNPFLNSNTVTVTDNAQGAQFIRKTSSICENADGTVSTTGTVFLTIAGPDPIKLEYKQQSSSTWTVATTDANTEEEIDNLLPNVTYDLRLTACGVTTTSQVTIAPLAPIVSTNTEQPCESQPYTLTVPTFAGATYEWKNAAGSVVSTTENYTIASYNTSYDGTYTCKIVFGDCVVRNANITVYGKLCGDDIGRYDVTGNVFHDLNGLNDSTVNGAGISSLDGEPLYISVVQDGVVVTTVAVQADGSYTIPDLPNGDYDLVITTNSLGSATPSIPDAWVSTGENIGTASGSDGEPNGILPITINNADIGDADFAVNATPESYDETLQVASAPVVGTPISLESVPLEGSDPEDNPTKSDWTGGDVIITTTPTNGFDLVYNNEVLEAGDTIKNYDPSLLSIVPTANTPNGTDSTQFEYAVIDQTGIADPTPATYTVAFDSPLPVTLIDFSADVTSDCLVNLHWKSGVESSFSRFDIERSADANRFGIIGSVPAKGSSSAYSFADDNAPKGAVYYRLKMMDKNNTFKYSKVLAANTICAGMGNIKVYPTVVANSVNVSGVTKGDLIRIYNNIGQLVSEQPAKAEFVTIDMSLLCAGVYNVQIFSAGEQSMTKVIKK